jgi:3-methyladenine DNA glycosylase/8-oxoguanine DNA glycosylase
MTLVALPAPYDFDLSVERFRVFGPDRAVLWEDGALYRAIDGQDVRIAGAPGGVNVEPHDPAIERHVKTLLGIDHDLAAFQRWAKGDPVLAEVVEQLAGFRPPVIPDPWEQLVGVITAQQVSLVAAGAIRNRFIERFGVCVGRVWAFPTRAVAAVIEPEELVAVGFSRAKAAATVALAQSELDLAGLRELPDDDVRVAIIAQKGLGKWSAEWFLARHLARPTAWPLGDLVLEKAAQRFYGVTAEELGPRLAPFQNLSAHYLLAALRQP